MSEGDYRLEKTGVIEGSEKQESQLEKDPDTLIADVSSSIAAEGNKALKMNEELLDKFKKNKNTEVGEIINESALEIEAALDCSRRRLKEVKEEIAADQSVESLPDDFKRAADMLAKALADKEKSAERGYIYTYGSLLEKTSKGREILIESLSWMEQNFYVNNGDVFQRLVLVAIDKIDNSIVGLQLSDIKSKENKQVATGEIITRLRGGGIAMPLSRAYEYILKRLANECEQNFPGYTKLEWLIENANLWRLEQLRVKETDDDLTSKEDEQKRWQSLYGDNGKFGLQKVGDYTYSKIIKPDIKEGVSYERQKVDLTKFKEIQELLKEFVD